MKQAHVARLVPGESGQRPCNRPATSALLLPAKQRRRWREFNPREVPEQKDTVLGTLLAVTKASPEPAKLIVLQHNGFKNRNSSLCR
jgi:hypothetical protein